MSSLRLNLPRGPLDVSDEGLDDDAALALLDQPTASERCRTNLSRLTRHARVAAKLKRWLRRAQMRLRVRAARRLQRWARSMAARRMLRQTIELARRRLAIQKIQKVARGCLARHRRNKKRRHAAAGRVRYYE